MEEDRIKNRHELDTNQVFVFLQCLCFVASSGVVSKPLQQGEMVFVKVPFQVQLVNKILFFLAGMRYSELFGQLVHPSHFDARQLENHFWGQGTDGAQERIGCLVFRYVTAIESFAGVCLVHFGHVR